VRAVVTTEGRPGIARVPEPVPEAGEALVAIRAFSLNRGELRLFEARPSGWRPGQDVAGIVLEAAADGSGPPAGTRVVALTDEAGWAERAAIPTPRLAVLPDAVSFGAAAALPVAGLTALRTLGHGAPLLGKRVLVTGAAGGVGTLAVQLARRAGASVTAIVGRPERARALAGLGAEAVLTDIADAAGPFALILESAGGASLEAAIPRVAAKGTIVVFGNSSGETAALDFRDFARCQNARIQSFFYFTTEPEERFAPDLALLVALVADGSLAPRIVEHDWHDLARVAPLLRARQIDGKAVFTIDAETTEGS
jgi:NADPH:quinone reductase-like Zn-dependent oxidoreductase